jgi:hypothetical protein
MTDITTTIDNYIAAWNERDDARRWAIVRETYADDARYVDPLQSGEGHDGIDAMLAGAQAQFPGHRFELSAGPDAYADRVRFAWRLVPDDGDRAIAAGVDFATIADDGRLADVTGFLEPVG